MEDEFVTYPIALRLKALGFDEPCLAAFEDNGNPFIYWNDLVNISELFNSQKFCEEKDYECLAPTWQSAFRWFRNKYMLYHKIDPLGYNMCLGSVGEFGKLYTVNAFADKHYGNYEEAQEACLEKLCDIVESKINSYE